MPWPRRNRRSSNRPAEPTEPTERTGHADELSGLWLDESFVREAPVVELSAEQRAAQGRVVDLHRYLEEGTRQAARTARSAHRARRLRQVPAALAIVVVVSVLGWQAVQRRLAVPTSSLHGAADPEPGRRVHTELNDLPPPSREQAAAPLGRPAPLAAESDRFAFTALRPGSNTPVAYDPCRPLHVVVNNRSAPPGGDKILDAALETVRKATGLVIVVDGVTDEAPTFERRPYQPDRYPGRWAPVLVAWSDPVESPMLADAVAGSGGSMAMSVPGGPVYVTGGVTLDGPQLEKVLDERGGKREAQAVIEHELAHLVGLNHIEDPTQLMNPVRVRGRASFGAGDLTGLALLGQGRCFPEV